MTEKYYLFKNERELSYLIGPKGFSNDSSLSFSELKIWRLYNKDFQTFVVTNNEDILAYFSEGLELVNVLVENQVPVEEIEISELSVEGVLPKMRLVNGFEISYHSNSTSRILCVLSNEKNKQLIHDYLDGGMSHAFYQDFGPNEKYQKINWQLTKSKMVMVTESESDEEGNPPGWVNLRLGKEASDKTSQNMKSVVFSIIGIIIFILYMIYG